MRAQPICKVEFTKIRKFAFFLITIMFYSKKCIIFASDFKTATKLVKNFNINKLKFRNYENKKNCRIQKRKRKNYGCKEF